MKKRFFPLPFLALLVTMVANSQSANPFINSWEGKLDVGVSLRIVFHIYETPGGIAATADSPDQSAFGLKCDTVIIKDDSIRIEMRALHAIVAGKLTGDSVISGTFTQVATVPLILKKGTGRLAALKRPQTPKPPFPYKSEEVEFDNADKSLHYGATITIPEGKGPFPAAVLITGSGPQDRDETILGHKPFAVLADDLTRNGFVVLRVDDRGVGKSTGNFGDATTVDFADDVNTSLNYLLSRPETDRKKTGLIGHSEGGMIAPMVASQRKDIDFIILLAGPGVKIDQLMTEQNIAILKSTGISQQATGAYAPLFKELMKESISPGDSAVIAAKMIHSIQSWKAKTDTSLIAELEFNDPKDEEGIVRSLMKQFSGKWFRYFLSFDPQPYLQKLHCKVLALNGSKDIQVLPASNLAGIESAFKKSNLKNYTIKELPGLNHLFQTCIKCTTTEYGQLEETFSPVALEEINTWLNKNVK